MMRFVAALALVGLSARRCASEAFVPARDDIIFGLGTTFYATDFSVMYWNDVLQVNFGSACAASYAVVGGEATLTAAAPRNCVPDCFNRGMSIQIAHGVMHFVPHTKRCYEEGARVRVARIVDESTMQYLRDEDVMFFETYAV